MKRLIIIYISFFITIAVIFLLLYNAAPHPEDAIVGSWKEKEWEYEMVDEKKRREGRSLGSRSEMRQQLVSNMPVRHEEEVWTFLPGGKLVISNEDTSKSELVLKWSIRGRGNILVLTYGNGEMEHYNLTKLEENRLVLNFELDSQIKGLAKLSFDKIPVK